MLRAFLNQYHKVEPMSFLFRDIGEKTKIEMLNHFVYGLLSLPICFPLQPHKIKHYLTFQNSHRNQKSKHPYIHSKHCCSINNINKKPTQPNRPVSSVHGIFLTQLQHSDTCTPFSVPSVGVVHM